MDFNDFLKQDVFFFVATIAILVLAIFFSLFLIRLIRITRKIEQLVDKAKSHAELVTGLIGSFFNFRKRK